MAIYLECQNVIGILPKQNTQMLLKYLYMPLSKYSYVYMYAWPGDICRASTKIFGTFIHVKVYTADYIYRLLVYSVLSYS